MNKPNFKVDLAKGHAGEALLLKMWPELVHLDGKHADFMCPDFSTLEVKSDQYNMHETPNMFIERWSDVKAKKPGGPWQAFGRGTTYFAYLYAANKVCYVFKTHELIEFLEQQKLAEIWVHNRSWVTVGYKVSRALVKHLVVKTLTQKDIK